MALGEVLGPLGGMVGSTFSGLAQYAWVLFIFVGVAIFLGIAYIVYLIRTKKTQWTHKLRVRRVIQGGQVTGGSQKLRLSEPIYINMRRFPLIKKAEVFELEKPLLGGYLLPELDQYSGENEFSIILDINNRIYTNQGEFFDPDKNSVNVSAKHSEIDIQRSNLKADFQNINQVNKRVEWATIAKFAFYAIAVIAIMVVTIVGLQNWGDAQKAKADEASAMASAMESLGEAMSTMEAVTNVQTLQILPMMKEFYGTNNIQSVIKEAKNETSQTS